jgi:hypothetical protein
LPQAPKHWSCHDNITDPVGAKDCYGIGIYWLTVRCHCGL